MNRMDHGPRNTASTSHLHELETWVDEILYIALHVYPREVWLDVVQGIRSSDMSSKTGVEDDTEAKQDLGSGLVNPYKKLDDLYKPLFPPY